MQPVVDVVIPAFNEEDSIALVVQDIPKQHVRHIIVCNNNSTDTTAQKAEEAGAVVVTETTPGYGAACLKGLEYIANQKSLPDIVVFLDGDYSDYPEQLPQFIDKMEKEDLDLVIGSRKLGRSQRGSLTIPQKFGNWLATKLIFLFYGYEFTDLGPFRSIRYKALQEIEMKDRDFGWTAEMQVKAAKHKLKYGEIPVDYKARIGVSKVSGTVRGTIMAGYKIIYTIFKYL